MLRINKINIVYCLIITINLLFLAFSVSAIYSNLNFLIFAKYFYHNICHQLESRSFYILSKPMLICTRCTGIFTGTLITFILILMDKRLNNFFSNLTNRTIILLFLPLIVDWSLNFIFKIESTNFVRFFTGFLFAIVPVHYFNLLITKT